MITDCPAKTSYTLRVAYDHGLSRKNVIHATGWTGASNAPRNPSGVVDVHYHAPNVCEIRFAMTHYKAFKADANSIQGLP